MAATDTGISDRNDLVTDGVGTTARRWVIRVGLALFAAMLAINLAKMLHFVWFSINYRYDLDYGEGIVWQQMRNIVAGTGYSPISVYPSIVYHYPPVFHLTSAGLAAVTGLDQLMAGRLVSVVSTFVMMILTGMLTAAALPAEEPRPVRWAAGLVAGLLLASAPEIVTWSSVMRVDMLGCAFTLVGLLFATHAAQRPALVLPAAIAFVLAIYTKQTSIAAPAAAFAGLWMARPRSAWLMLTLCLGFGFAALAYLSMQTHGGFLHHIILYNINRLDLGRTRALIYRLIAEIILLAITAIAVREAWRRLRPQLSQAFRDRLLADSRLTTLAILLIFLVMKAAMLPMILKSGSADNYLIEWLCVLSIFVGLGVAPALLIALGGEARVSLLLLVLIVAGLPLSMMRVGDATPTAAETVRESRSMAGLVEHIRASPKPVISDDMSLLIRAGRPVMWEPSIEAELGHEGRYDEKAFAQMVRRGDFAFFITRNVRGHNPFDERYNPVVADAMDIAYPRLVAVSGLTIHLPPQ